MASPTEGAINQKNGYGGETEIPNFDVNLPVCSHKAMTGKKFSTQGGEAPTDGKGNMIWGDRSSRRCA